MPKPSKKIVWFDFDGTLERYTEWKGEGVFGPFIQKCVELIRYWRSKGYSTVVHTARPDIALVKKYCEQLPEDAKIDDVTNKKPSAALGYDDRVVTFIEQGTVAEMIYKGETILLNENFQERWEKGHSKVAPKSRTARRAFSGK